MKLTKNQVHQTQYFKLYNCKNRVQIDREEGLIYFCFEHLTHIENCYKQCPFNTWIRMFFWNSSSLDWSPSNQIIRRCSFYWHHIYQRSKRFFGLEKILSHRRISNGKKTFLQFCWSSWKWENCLCFSNWLCWFRWFVLYYQFYK